MFQHEPTKNIMSAKKEVIKEKTCFVVMPIADMDDYESGHFTRVYNHLIKPACVKVGFKPVRADDVASSNYIVIDILNKIIESDMVICDLSGRNPNVMYELGIRHAFNLPTVLIKDIKTTRIFDIQGLRCVDYNQSLRIDTVERNVESISNALIETEKANGHDINSIVQLLGISPAAVPKSVELSDESRLLLSAIKDLSGRIGNIESSKFKSISSRVRDHRLEIQQVGNDKFIINGCHVELGDELFIRGNSVGVLIDADPASILLRAESGGLIKYGVDDPDFRNLDVIPF